MQFQGSLLTYKLTFYKTPKEQLKTLRYTLYLFYIFSMVKLFIMMISNSVIPFNLYLPNTTERGKRQLNYTM